MQPVFEGQVVLQRVFPFQPGLVPGIDFPVCVDQRGVSCGASGDGHLLKLASTPILVARADQSEWRSMGKREVVENGHRFTGCQNEAQVCGELPISSAVAPCSAVQVAHVAIVQRQLVPAFALHIAGTLRRLGG